LQKKHASAASEEPENDFGETEKSLLNAEGDVTVPLYQFKILAKTGCEKSGFVQSSVSSGLTGDPRCPVVEGTGPDQCSDQDVSPDGATETEPSTAPQSRFTGTRPVRGRLTQSAV